MKVRIKSQPTPNPLAMKYVMDRDVRVGGKVSINDASVCLHVPLARLLLQLPSVTQVHFFENAITVTQDGDASWRELDDDVQEIIEAQIDAHDPEFLLDDATPTISTDRSELSPELRQIEEILDRTVRPGLQADGGDLEVLELDGHVLTIRYEGACGGCPSAMMGTLQAIQGILRSEFDEELMVVAL